ncbi:Uncharacterised protein [Vibrio cholerae]|nr:Uncharacterised protein [Vibrio cholerae]
MRGCSKRCSTVCSSTVLSSKVKYCLGRSACMRLPTPAAGTIAVMLFIGATPHR